MGLNLQRRHLKPGGWVEQVELSTIARSDDETVKPDSAQRKWAEVFGKFGEVTGKSFAISETAGEVIKEAGFVNVKKRTLKMPIGTWPKNKDLKRWGAWNRQFILQGLEGFSIRGLTEHLGVSLTRSFPGEELNETLFGGCHFPCLSCPC